MKPLTVSHLINLRYAFITVLLLPHLLCRLLLCSLQLFTSIRHHLDQLLLFHFPSSQYKRLLVQRPYTSLPYSPAYYWPLSISPFLRFQTPNPFVIFYFFLALAHLENSHQLRNLTGRNPPATDDHSRPSLLQGIKGSISTSPNPSLSKRQTCNIHPVHTVKSVLITAKHQAHESITVRFHLGSIHYHPLLVDHSFLPWKASPKVAAHCSLHPKDPRVSTPGERLPQVLVPPILGLDLITM